MRSGYDTAEWLYSNRVFTGASRVWGSKSEIPDHID
jgi:hypothetical protein